MDKLKPCPFCGETERLYTGARGWKYTDENDAIKLFGTHCRICGSRTRLFETAKEAIDAWNMRAGDKE